MSCGRVRFGGRVDARIVPIPGGCNDGMPTAETLDELTELAQRHAQLFVRWSRGPAADVTGTSSDDLTGVPLPGLSASPARRGVMVGRAAAAVVDCPALV